MGSSAAVFLVRKGPLSTLGSRTAPGGAWGGGCSGELRVLQGVLPESAQCGASTGRALSGALPGAPPNSPGHSPEHLPELLD